MGRRALPPEERRKRIVAYTNKWAKNNPEKVKKHRQSPMRARIGGIRSRAKRKGLEFDLTEKFLIELSERTLICPLTDIPLRYDNQNRLADDHAELDRKDNTKGYIKDNVWFISKRANRIKTDSTPDEMIQVAQRLKQLL